MALVLIDTSTARCAVLLRAKGKDTLLCESAARGQDGRLALMVREALGKAKLTPKDITQIGVIVGPGAFTGVRIGVAFARAFGLALGKPVMGINALDVFALSGGTHEFNAGVCDIGRGELAYRLSTNGKLQGNYETAAVETVLARLRRFGDGKRVTLAGSAAYMADQDILIDSGAHALDLTRTADLLDGGALPRLEALPWYHRPPDAKLPAKPLGSKTP